MSGDNGEINKEQEQVPEEKTIIKIIAKPDGSFEMKSTLQPPMVVWIFEQIKAQFFIPQQKSPILQPPGGIMNFVRGGFRKK